MTETCNNIFRWSDLLECMNGEHKDDIAADATLQFIFERLVGNIDNWAISTKILIILHRGLQNIKVNRKIYKEMKEKEHLLHPYECKKENKEMIRTYMNISKLYVQYIKLFLQVANKTDILTKRMTRMTEEVHVLKTQQILKNSEFFEQIMSKAFQMLKQYATQCRQTRLFSNVIFMCFKDIVKVYKVYY